MKWIDILWMVALVLPLGALCESPIQNLELRGEQDAIVVQVSRGHVVVLGWEQAGVATSVRSWPEDFQNQEILIPSDEEARQSDFEGSLRVEAKSNGVTLNFRAARKEQALFVWLPVQINLKVSVTGGGSVAVRGTRGEVDVQSMQGKVLLDQIWGPVVAHALNEDLWVRFSALVAEKPNYLSSLNGDVSVLLPKGADASFELDFFNGEVDTTIPITLVPGTNVWAADGSTVFEPSRSAETNRKGTHFRIKNHNGNIIIKDYESIHQK